MSMGDHSMMKRTEIDTTAPFQSVREAVALFGEKILAGEVYATKLKRMHGEASTGNGYGTSKPGNITAELDETKQSLEKAREESMQMAHNLSFLTEELERTKRELQQLKTREPRKQLSSPLPDELETGDIKTKFEVKVKSRTSEDEEGTEIQKKKYVRFVNPPLAEEVVVPCGVGRLERQSSLGVVVEEKDRRKKKMMKKKKTLIPLIRGIFSKKKRNEEAA